MGEEGVEIQRYRFFAVDCRMHESKASEKNSPSPEELNLYEKRRSREMCVGRKWGDWANPDPFLSGSYGLRTHDIALNPVCCSNRRRSVCVRLRSSAVESALTAQAIVRLGVFRCQRGLSPRPEYLLSRRRSWPVAPL